MYAQLYLKLRVIIIREPDGLWNYRPCMIFGEAVGRVVKVSSDTR